ncbi:MFS transporter [Nocardioides euryhalodurans]|uniref:MFS transporter n=1 Tax=Nocardioides euryhalodurans TaxID=2518370 RepID=A0A4V1BDF5_9ACTN|nr:MFS transporter [Nocardioides euryhalodurans]QBR90942.1 MFS transporter [Nocardioides euryhalodurans]
MLSTYRRILSVPGGLRFSAAGMVGRLPISMMGLGIVLLVQAATGSYGLAGSVAAAYVVANAVFAVVQGRLLDRLGQARVLVPVVLVFAAAAIALVVSVQAGWPRWTSWLLAAVAGAGLPTAGTCVRARWSYALRGRPRDLQTAFALEAVVDESVFILGPILVTVLATAVHPVAGLATAVGTGLLGTLALAVQRGTEPPPAPPRDPAVAHQPLPWRTLVPLLVVQLALGTLFGAAEVVTVAFADEQGSQAYAGPLLAVWALGSLLAGLVTGAITWRRGPDVRVRVGAVGMFVAMAPLAFIGSVPLMGLALLVGGCAIAPTLIASTSLTEQVVSPGRLTEGMALLHTGIVAGVAPGATAAGFVVDHAGASAAYLVPLGAGAVAAVAAQLLPRRAQERSPVTALDQ